MQMKLDMSEKNVPLVLYNFTDFLFRYYGKKVIILLDEYDTPMQEAYVDGYFCESNEPSESLISFGDCLRPGAFGDGLVNSVTSLTFSLTA